MDIDRILELKEKAKEEKARELSNVDYTIRMLLIDIQRVKTQIEELNNELKVKFSYEVLVRQRALLSILKDNEKKLNDLQILREIKAQELKEIYTEIKALERLKASTEYSNRKKQTQLDQINLGFLSTLKKSAMLIGIIFPLISFSESALSKKIKQEQRSKAESDMQIISKELELKLKRLEEEKKVLEEERRKLEELRRQKEEAQIKPTEQKEIEKWIAIINRTSPDEAGAMMNELDPNLAAQILLRLKERQAAQILEAMNPKKSAEVSKIIMSSKTSKGGKP